MIQVTPQMKILLAVEPTDFRKGIDGLACVCREKIGLDPFSGSLFVFRNRRGTAIKLLAYDGQGFWLCQKRWSKGRLRWWPKGTGEPLRTLAVHQMQMLLWNGDPTVQVAPAWRPLLSFP